MRFVFDTNVIISASLFETSTPAQAFYEAIDRGELLLSKAVLKEVSRVLQRERFDRYVSMETRKRFLKALVREGRLVEVTEQIEACRDPDDDKFLELAVSGGADVIVSGDKDLTDLDPFRGIRILTPAAFLEADLRQL